MNNDILVIVLFRVYSLSSNNVSLRYQSNTSR